MMYTGQKDKNRPEKRGCAGTVIGCVLTSLLLAAAIALCLFTSFQVRAQGYVSVGGFSLFRVVTGSMEPAISVGELLLCRSTAADRIRTGDIICYRTEQAEISGAVVTHRVVSIGTDEHGSPCFVTQGDANLMADPHRVGPEDLVGRVVWYSGKESVLNDVLSFLTGKIGFLACIVFPVLLTAGLILQSAVKSLWQEMAQLRKELDGGGEASPQETEQPEQPDAETPLPGYTLLTRKDYEDILAKLREERIGELRNHADPEEDAQGRARTE